MRRVPRRTTRGMVRMETAVVTMTTWTMTAEVTNKFVVKGLGVGEWKK